MKLVFLFPFINEYVGTPLKWLPLSTSTLIGYLRRHFPKIIFHQFDLEEEVKTAISEGKLSEYYLGILTQFFSDKKDEAVIKDEDLKEDLIKFKNFFADLVDHFRLKEYDCYFFAVYNRNKIGIRANILLAKYLKEIYKDKKIIFGGIYGFGQDLSKSSFSKFFSKFDFIDSFVGAQGEISTKEIIERLLMDQNLKKYYLSMPSISPEEFLRELPDFESFRSFKYFQHSPRELEQIYNIESTKAGKDEKFVFIPYRFSRGCFWAKCAYCAQSKRFSKFDHKDIKTIIKDLIRLKETYQTKYFIFFNSNFNFDLNFSKELLRAFIKNKLDILWTDSFNLNIIDEELLDLMVRGGCFRADIGTSTLNPRIQKLYNNILQDNKNLENLKKMAQNGIWTHINLIANMPHQYSIEKEKTILKKYMGYIDGVSLNNYRRYSQSDLALNYKRYNLDWIDINNCEQIPLSFVEKDFRGTIDDRKRVFSKNFVELSEFLYSFGDLANSVNSINVYLLGYLYNTLGFKEKNKIKKIINNAKLDLNKA